MPPLTLESLKQLVAKLEQEKAFLDQQNPQGDGTATYLDPMTDEEYAKWEHDEQLGWRDIYKQMLGHTYEG